MITRTLLVSIAFAAAVVHGQELKEESVVTVAIPDQKYCVNPMIYGQMFEHVNDPMMYGGLLNEDGTERPHVNRLMKELTIPIIRWPGGTLVHEYDWKNAIGPLDQRPKTYIQRWKIHDSNRFGTDEFIQYCRKIGAEPYINFNMSTTGFKGSKLSDALEWLEYVNGAADSKWRKIRARNGHPKPSNVKYFCLGNENYASNGVNKKETAAGYGQRCKSWATAIRARYPSVELLAVGYDLSWNRGVLEEAGQHIDWLTVHAYVTSVLKNGKLKDPEGVLFASAKMDACLRKICRQVNEANRKFGRASRPIRVSIDEWNNRHKVSGTLSRMDDRRQFDAAVVGGMLNAFVRNSPSVGMANYIFPVDSHGLIRTIGDGEAFKTPIYYVFQQYRKWMIGQRLDASVTGPGLGSEKRPAPASITSAPAKFPPVKRNVPFVDAAAVMDSGTLTMALINRSHEEVMSVKLKLPKGYRPTECWQLAHPNIYARNTATSREEVVPIRDDFADETLKLRPCGLYLVRCEDK